jgi:signal transduction histidine kinase
MKRGIQKRIGLSLFFSFVVFVIFAITALIVSLVSFTLLRSGLIGGVGRYEPFAMIAIVLVACVLVGTAVSFVLGRVPLRSIRRVVAAINRLAEGDFSARLEIAHPPEFKELAVSFNRMAEELGGIELLRTDFVNNFSHEFKTPIVSIKGFAELLRQDGLTPAERDEYLDIVISESGRLAALATNVLNLSKVENQTILTDKQPFALGEQLRRCILMFEPKWTQKALALSVDIQDMLCSGSEELLSQLWLNLIDNAVKFTPEGGEIDVSLMREGDTAHFVLCNSGPGIRPEDASHIFDKFYQADRSHGTAGNGLGLTLAKKIVLLHGGGIGCDSRPGGGTTFTVTLPLK